jgi:hypothetical protein
MAPRLENRSARRVAATEREKRRMESFNVKADAIRDIVCPTMKSATKAKVLRAAVDRLISLEALAAKMTGNNSSPLQKTFNHVTPPVVEDQLSFSGEKSQAEYTEALYQASSPSDSWSTPVDYSKSYTENYANVIYYDENANMYQPTNSYPAQPDILTSQIVAYSEDARVSFSDSYDQLPQPEMTPIELPQPEITQAGIQQPEMITVDHFFKEFEAQLNETIL